MASSPPLLEINALRDRADTLRAELLDVKDKLASWHPLFHPVPQSDRQEYVVFVVDVSGSMYKHLPLVQEELCRTIEHIPDSYMFNVVAYSKDVHVLSPHPLKSHEIERACEWVRNLTVESSTNTLRALQTVFHDLNGVTLVHLLTDGFPDDPPGDVISAVKALSDENRAIVLHTIVFACVDPRAQTLMKQLADISDGTYVEYTEDMRQRLESARQEGLPDAHDERRLENELSVIESQIQNITLAAARGDRPVDDRNHESHAADIEGYHNDLDGAESVSTEDNSAKEEHRGDESSGSNTGESASACDVDRAATINADGGTDAKQSVDKAAEPQEVVRDAVTDNPDMHRDENNTVGQDRGASGMNEDANATDTDGGSQDKVPNIDRSDRDVLVLCPEHHRYYRGTTIYAEGGTDSQVVRVVFAGRDHPLGQSYQTTADNLVYEAQDEDGVVAACVHGCYVFASNIGDYTYAPAIVLSVEHNDDISRDTYYRVEFHTGQTAMVERQDLMVTSYINYETACYALEIEEIRAPTDGSALHLKNQHSMGTETLRGDDTDADNDNDTEPPSDHAYQSGLGLPDTRVDKRIRQELEAKRAAREHLLLAEREKARLAEPRRRAAAVARAGAQERTRADGEMHKQQAMQRKVLAHRERARRDFDRNARAQGKFDATLQSTSAEEKSRRDHENLRREMAETKQRLRDQRLRDQEFTRRAVKEEREQRAFDDAVAKQTAMQQSARDRERSIHQERAWHAEAERASDAARRSMEVERRATVETARRGEHDRVEAARTLRLSREMKRRELHEYHNMDVLDDEARSEMRRRAAQTRREEAVSAEREAAAIEEERRNNRSVQAALARRAREDTQKEEIQARRAAILDAQRQVHTNRQEAETMRRNQDMAERERRADASRHKTRALLEQRAAKRADEEAKEEARRQKQIERGKQRPFQNFDERVRNDPGQVRAAQLEQKRREAHMRRERGDITRNVMHQQQAAMEEQLARMYPA